MSEIIEIIETGAGRPLPAVGRDVCAAVRRAAGEGAETRQSIGGRPVAAIVPLGGQAAAPPGSAERAAESVRQAVRQLILGGQQGTEVDLPELGEVIVIERRAAR